MADAWASFVQSLPKSERPRPVRPIRLVCFDMDGVLTRHASSWLRIHEHFGVDNGPGFEAFLRQEIDDHEFIRRDVGLWLSQRPDLTIHEVNRMLDDVGMVDGAPEACQRLREAGCELAIVSGGLDYAAWRLAQTLGIELVSANGLVVTDNGRLTGEGIVQTPLADKGAPVRRFALQLGIPLGAVATVGNSAPDIPMFRASGLGIAFRPADPHVVAAADVYVKNRDLRAVAEAILA